MNLEIGRCYAYFKEALSADGYIVVYDGDDWSFSWSPQGRADLLEVGPPCTTSARAWATALHHRLSNSHIMHTRFMAEIPEMQKFKEFQWTYDMPSWP